MYIRYPGINGTLGPGSFPLEAPNGTAAAPSFAFGGGTGGAGTGMYAAGTNILAWATAGTTRGNISAAGLWTLGTAAGIQEHIVNGALKVTSAQNAAVTTVNLVNSGTGEASSAFQATSGASSVYAYYSSAAGNQAAFWFAGQVGATTKYSINYGGSSGNAAISTNYFVIDSATTGVSSHGTNTNDNAAAGFVGEYIESVISTPTAWPVATTVWGDATTISLTAGDWDITGFVQYLQNGATVSQFDVAISVNSGITTTDQIEGSNQIGAATAGALAINRGGVVPAYRKSLSGTTTIYLKLRATFAVATPNYQCRISARRMR